MANLNRSFRMSRAAMRLALALGAVTTLGALGAATPASAQGAWCAYYHGPAGGTNCGFYTYGQCRAAISGVGGICSPSPYARYSDRPLPRRKLRRHYR